MSWAFGVRRSISLSGIYALAKHTRPRKVSDEVLSRIDILTQKGMIKSYVFRQTPIARYHLLARYSRNKERIDAQNKIRDYILAKLPTGIHNKRMYYELVAKFYGKQVDISAVAEHMNIEPFVVLAGWAKVDGMLNDLSYRVEGEALEHYREERLIGD